MTYGKEHRYGPCMVGRAAEERAVRKLRGNLASGRWAERNREILGLHEADLGARLLISRAPSGQR